MSGVGKTTLLNLLGGLDRPSEGRVFLDGEDLFAGTDREVAAVRNRKIGFVFQVYPPPARVHRRSRTSASP